MATKQGHTNDNYVRESRATSQTQAWLLYGLAAAFVAALVIVSMTYGG